MQVSARTKRSPSLSQARVIDVVPSVPRGHSGGEAQENRGQHGSGSVVRQSDRPAPRLKEVGWYETQFALGDLVDVRHTALVPEGDEARVIPIGDADLIVAPAYF